MRAHSSRIILSAIVVVAFIGCSGRDTPTGAAEHSRRTSANASAAIPLDEGAIAEAERAQKAAKDRAARRKQWAALKAATPKADAAQMWATAEREHAAQNHKDAADAFVAFAVHHPQDPRFALAVKRAMASRFALNAFRDGLTFVDAAIVHAPSDVVRARLLRMLGNSYLAIPHWGTTRGGEFHRAQHGQGTSTQTYFEDRTAAIERLEQARALMAKLAPSPASKAPATPAKPATPPPPTAKDIDPATTSVAPLTAEERLETQLELVGAIARFTPYDSSWNYWWYGWAASQDDGLVDAEGEDERAGHYRRSWHNELYASQPKGLEVTKDGDIVFAPLVASYEKAEEDTAKIKFLLDEVRTTSDFGVDDGPAKSLLLQAMLFYNRDGVHRLDRLRNHWWGGSYRYKAQVEAADLYTLDDNEVFGLVATHLQRFSVPPDESFPALVSRLEREHPKSAATDEAVFLLGQFYQGRQQYDKARAVYERAIQERPKSAYTSRAKAALAELARQEVGIRWAGAQPAGTDAKVNLRFRNLKEVELRFRRVDQEKILRDFKAAYREGAKRRSDVVQPNNLGYALVQNYHQAVERYAPTVTSSVKRALEPNVEGRYVDAMVSSGVKAPGLYVVDAHLPNQNTRLGRGLLLVESIAVVQKRDQKGAFNWVVDAVSGRPVANAKVERFEYWHTYKYNQSKAHSQQSNVRSDTNGIVRMPQTSHQTLTTVRGNGGIAFVGWGYYYGRYSVDSSRENESVALVMTDRPVYRPGDKVGLKVWARKKRNGVYVDATKGGQVELRIRTPQGETLEQPTLKLSSTGAAEFSFVLKDDASLGAYGIQPLVDGGYARVESATFRVEEYKAPEFTVSVKAAGQARLGETIEAEVAADYLFGGGVAGGKVHYKVFRQDHEHKMVAPGRWDWLYGAGYGYAYYHYGWFDWWDHMGPVPIVWYPWWGPKPESPKELVKEGEAKLDDKGRLKIKIDTQPAKDALGKSDHRYTIEAEVVDLSRRLIKGEGSVVVTRNAFFASIQSEAGYWRASESAQLSVVTQKPDGQPLSVAGKVEVQRVSYVGESATDAAYTDVETIPATTDEQGLARVTFEPKATGQYRVSFVAKDAWGGEVRQSALVWVVGPQWHGRNYRFNGLELLMDKRTYKQGDVARLLVNSDQPGASVLLATRVDQGVLLDYKIVQLRGKSMVVEIPITEARVPNFFVEATTVAKGTLFEELREVYVPPEDVELKIEVTADKTQYGPGDDVTLDVKTSSSDGTPVAADVALSVFDSAVLYIQPETTPDPRKLFWASKRHHTIQSQSSLKRPMHWSDQLRPPDRQAYWTLQSMGHRYFQQEVYWANQSAVDGLRGGDVGRYKDKNDAGDEEAEDALAPAPSSRKDRAKREAKGVGGLGSRGSGAGGGGFGRAAANKSSLASAQDAPPEADVANEPMAEANGKKRAEGEPRLQTEDASAPKKAASVRRNFADTAHFAPTVQTDSRGRATVRFKLPDNLTTWRVKAIGLSAKTRAGENTTTLLTTKKLLVRLQAPRFFRERDRVVLSAVVHNGGAKSESVEVSIGVTDALLKLEGKRSQKVTVAAGQDVRVDFPALVTGEGMASIRMDAVGKTESDAKELRFPVYVHGMTKTVSAVGSIAADAPATSEKSIVLDVPADRREDLSRLEVRFSPTLAGGMLDALPYLLDYPYGCTEQTLSRFVPAVLTRKALQQAGGLKLEALGTPGKTNLNPQQLTASGDVDKKRLEREHRLLERSPVFDTAELNRMIAAGLLRLTKMQNGDGGWGWWGRDGSSRYTTAHVVGGLLDAQEADLALDQGMLQRGKRALSSLVSQNLWRYKGDTWIGNDDAYAAWVMSRYGEKNAELNTYLWERRDRLSAYGKILAAMAFHLADDKKKAAVFLKNAEQSLQHDDENETSWLETNQRGWWYWYNDGIETNALYLRALNTMKRGDKVAPRIVKWLLNHRKNGYYWRSTRDTASVVAAFADHMQKSGERRADYDLDILLDGEVVKTVHVDKDNLFTFDNVFALEGAALTSGKHTLTFRRRGKGAVYFNSYLSYFTTEEDVTAAGLEIKVDRSYYKLVRRDRVRKMQGDRGQPLEVTEVAYAKVPLASGAELESGDLVLVELMLESKNDYTFLAFEDPKPAGMEAVAIRSGQTFGEAVANMELRDEKVVFFLRELTQGKLKLTYRLRAEIPGAFHAMPTLGFGMYAPELKANSDEMRVTIVDAP